MNSAVEGISVAVMEENINSDVVPIFSISPKTEGNNKASNVMLRDYEKKNTIIHYAYWANFANFIEESLQGVKKTDNSADPGFEIINSTYGSRGVG